MKNTVKSDKDELKCKISDKLIKINFKLKLNKIDDKLMRQRQKMEKG